MLKKQIEVRKAKKNRDQKDTNFTLIKAERETTLKKLKANNTCKRFVMEVSKQK